MNQPALATRKKRRGYILLGVGITAVALIALLPDPMNNPKEKAERDRAIAAIQTHYSPSEQLLSMNPDVSNADWVAVPDPLCEGKDSDCWRVEVYVDVMPAAEKKTIRTQWIVDLKSGQIEPENTEARLMYIPALERPR